jgi:Flp pilus assembly protein TadG
MVRVMNARGDSERGAVAVIVAVCAIAVFAMAAFAIDAGNLWQSRRHLITATDAASLAAAEEYALGGNGCGGTDDTFVTSNDPDAEVTDCTHTAGPTAGRVTVNATSPVDFTFAAVMGIGDTDVDSSTTAVYGVPESVTGLRPLGLCTGSTGFQQWLASGMTVPFTATIAYNKDHPDACGGEAPGNWGVFDFNGGSNSNNETRDWLANGYDGNVEIGQWVEGNPGAFSNSLGTELSELKSKGTIFALPVFDAVQGNGANAEFHLVAVVSVRLVDYKATGSQAQRFIRVEFHKYIAQGRCCGGGTDTGTRVVTICAVDPDFDISNCS